MNSHFTSITGYGISLARTWSLWPTRPWWAQEKGIFNRTGERGPFPGFLCFVWVQLLELTGVCLLLSPRQNVCHMQVNEDALSIVPYWGQPSASRTFCGLVGEEIVTDVSRILYGRKPK